MSYLGQFGTLVMGADIESWDESLSRRIPMTDVERRHGVLVTGDPVLAQRTISVNGMIAEASETARRTRMNLYGLNLAEGISGELYKYTDRYYNARCESFAHQEAEGSGMSAESFQIVFLCDDPFVYNSTPTTETKVPTGSPYIWTHTNGGGYLVYPTITLVADAGGSLGCTNPRLTNTTTGKYVQYTGNVAPGASLVIDCAKFTVKIGGVSYLQNFAWAGVFIWLAVGANALSLTCSGDTPTSIALTYNQRWIEE